MIFLCISACECFPFLLLYWANNNNFSMHYRKWVLSVFTVISGCQQWSLFVLQKVSTYCSYCHFWLTTTISFCITESKYLLFSLANDNNFSLYYSLWVPFILTVVLANKHDITESKCFLFLPLFLADNIISSYITDSKYFVLIVILANNNNFFSLYYSW